MFTQIWKGLASVRLALVLLLLLAAGAVLGTVLPQQESWEFYRLRLGEWPAAFFWRLGLQDIYRSPIYLSLLGLLGLNLVACSLKRLPDTWRRLRRQPDLQEAQTWPLRLQETWRPAKAVNWPAWEARLHRTLGAGQKIQAGTTTWYLCHRGQWGRLGPYLIHLSILIVLTGAVIGRLWGLQGELELLEGETRQHLTRSNPVGQEALGFGVRLDRFVVEFYPNGTPKEFRSDLTFLPPGQPPVARSCRVNDPVTFGKFTFYQSTYQTLPRLVRLRIQTAGQEFLVEAPFRQRLALPNGLGLLMVWRLEPNLAGLGPALQLAYRGRQGGHPLLFWVLAQPPGERQPEQPEDFRVAVEQLELTYASGLLVKYDPGVGVVYLGFLLLLPAFWLAFFTPRQRWAVALVPQNPPGSCYQIRVYGVSDRRSGHWQKRVQQVREILKEFS